MDDYVKRLLDARKRLELVEASFSLSYDLLSSELQRLWCLLSVFPADFDLTAAAAVWQRDRDPAEESLGELLKWSLVEFDPAGKRYRLHDLARDYAASRLQAEDKAQAEQHHAEPSRSVLSASKEQYIQGGENVSSGLAFLDREWANIRAGQAWAERNLQGSRAAASLCSSYPDAGAYVLDLRLHPRERIRWLETALAAARQMNDRNSEGVHLGNLGSAYADLGDARKAIEYYQQALAIAREIGDRRGEGNALWNMSLALDRLGKRDEAVKLAQDALAIYQQIESPAAELVRRQLAQWQG